jgi:hypothetical protein
VTFVGRPLPHSAEHRAGAIGGAEFRIPGGFVECLTAEAREDLVKVQVLGFQGIRLLAKLAVEWDDDPPGRLIRLPPCSGEQDLAQDQQRD